MARIFKPASSKPGRKPGQAKARPRTPVTLDITDLGDDGRGIARCDSKVVFVSGALPGEQVEAVVETSGRRFDEARVGKVLSASPQRAQAPCVHYGHCGGCQVQHLDYPGQVGWKQRRLRRLLQQVGVEQVLDTPITAQAWGYRHRARLAFRYRREAGLVVGFREGSSHRIVALQHCPLLQPALSENIDPLVAALTELLKAAGQGEILICAGADRRLGVAVRGRYFPGIALCAATAAGLEGLAELVQVSSENGNCWNNSSVKSLFYQTDKANSSFEFTPQDFTQANPEVNAQMVARALDWLAPGADDVIADYFCGLGNFSLPLARHCKAVLGYELDAGMVESANRNARRLGLEKGGFEKGGLGNAHFRQADLFTPQPQLLSDIDAVLLDPPRAGARALCELLAASAISRILYVSCDPATLARDLAILTGGGYRVSRAAIADMFPQTRHLESMVLLQHA